MKKIFLAVLVSLAGFTVYASAWQPPAERKDSIWQVQDLCPLIASHQKCYWAY